MKQSKEYLEQIVKKTLSDRELENIIIDIQKDAYNQALKDVKRKGEAYSLIPAVLSDRMIGGIKNFSGVEARIDGRSINKLIKR